jgi:hypothetical protein
MVGSMFGWPSFNITLPAGDVTQQISPSLISMNSVNYEGVPAIERDVVTKVASFGKQIGIISEAVLELADGGDGGKMKRLRQIVAEVENVKAQNRLDVERSAEEAMNRLRKLDSGLYKDLLARLQREPHFPDRRKSGVTQRPRAGTSPDRS